MLGQSFNCTIFVPYKVYFEILALSQTVWAESYQFQSKKSFDLSLKWWIDCFFDRAYDIVYISDRSGWSRAFVFPFLIWTSIPHSIHQEALLALVIWVVFVLKGQERTPPFYPPLQKPPFTASSSPNIILPRPRPDAPIEKISA